MRQSTQNEEDFNELAEQVIQSLLDNVKQTRNRNSENLKPFILHICDYLTVIDLLLHPLYLVCHCWNQELITNQKYWKIVLNGIHVEFEPGNSHETELYCREKIKAWYLQKKCGPVRYIEGKLVPIDRDSWENEDYSPVDHLKIVTLDDKKSDLSNQVFIIDYNKESCMILDYFTTDEQVPSTMNVFDNYCGYWFSTRTPKWFLFEINYSRYEEEARSTEYTCFVKLYKNQDDFNERKNEVTIVNGMNTSLKKSREILEKWLSFENLSKKECEKSISTIISEILPHNSWKDYSKYWKFDGEFVYGKKKKKLHVEELENGTFTF